MSALLIVIVASPALAQSIHTEENIETDGQLLSGVATGTPPLVVSSTTRVDNLNVDRLDGLQGADLALAANLQSLRAALTSVQTEANLILGKAPPARTGQTTCYDEAGAVIACGTGTGTGQDGDLQLGTAWPNPRFTKNGDGTVTDNLTGLVWLEDAGCFDAETWTDALAAAGALFDGSTNDPLGGDCGLVDGSIAGEWRLPNLRELASLVHQGFASPAIPDTAGTGQWAAGDPFANVQAFQAYWSSTSRLPLATSAFAVLAGGGSPGHTAKTGSARVWPVRGASRVARTGQTTCYDTSGAAVACGTGIGLVQDGHLQLGVAAPSPRFTSNGDGTVSDNLTGLVWLENADCFGALSWVSGLTAAAGLFDGSTVGALGDDCGLSDGSLAGTWRVPNVVELASLMDYGLAAPALSNSAGTGQWSAGDPFTNVLAGASRYWTSTTRISQTNTAWTAFFENGHWSQTVKAAAAAVLWPVRSGG